jgi:multidrug efflux pump
MGGLIVATVLTLFFLPALYAAWFRVRPTEPVQQSEAQLLQLASREPSPMAAE